MNGLAIVGAASLLVASAGWLTPRGGPYVITGQVRDPNGRALVGLSVFLDRGTNLVERYETDSAGSFRLPLFAREPHRAVWLVCAPGAIPLVGKPELDEFTDAAPTLHIYDSSPYPGSAWGFYRASGWSGPIPRECPRGVDSVGWRYPASTGKDWGAFTTTEPDWARFPGPPALPHR